MSGNVPCSSYIPSPHMPTPPFGVKKLEKPKNFISSARNKVREEVHEEVHEEVRDADGDEPISVEKIAKEMMLDMDEYKFLLEMYISTNRKVIDNMENHFATLSFDELAKDVHALRGSSGNLFLKQMANQCSKLEDYVHKRELEPAVKEFHKVKEIFEIIASIKSGF